MFWIRCPRCDCAFQVTDENPLAQVRCGHCGSKLGSVADAGTQIEHPLDIQPVATLEGHTNQVWSVAFSPDGKWLASGSIDRTLKLWNTAAGEAEATLEGHTGGVLAVAYSPDGSTLASGGKDHTVRLWDVPTRKERAVLNGYTDSSLAFSPDGRLLATGSIDDSVRFWEVDNGQELPTLHVHRNSVRSVAFSPDGHLIGLGHLVGSGITLQLWDLETQSVRFTFLEPENVTSVTFSPDGTVLAAAGLAGQIKRWDVATGRERAALTPLGRNQYFLPSAVLSIAFSPEGLLLAAGLHLQVGANVQVWDQVAGQVRAALQAHRNSVQSVAFSPDGATLATASRDRTIRLWRLAPSG